MAQGVGIYAISCMVPGQLAYLLAFQLDIMVIIRSSNAMVQSNGHQLEADPSPIGLDETDSHSQAASMNVCSIGLFAL